MSNSLRPHGYQAPPSMGFSRQEYWSGLPFPFPGYFPTQGLNPGLQHCRQMLYHLRSSERANFCFIDYAKAFDCVDHNKLWEIRQEMGTPERLTFLLRNLYAGQQATVRTGQGTTDSLQIGKGVRQGCILSPYLFNLYGEYIMRKAGLDEAQAGIKMPGKI